MQLANLLSELAPGEDGWAVKFQCGGSEVTEAAIKLARQYHRLTGNPGNGLDLSVRNPVRVGGELDGKDGESSGFVASFFTQQ